MLLRSSTLEPLDVGKIKQLAEKRRVVLTRSTEQGIGAAQDAARMQRVVSFYEALPRGPAPEVKARGLFARYQARYFGKNPSSARASESNRSLSSVANAREQPLSMLSHSSWHSAMRTTITSIYVCRRPVSDNGKADAVIGHHKNNAH